MGLCDTVAKLADAAERDLSPSEARHKLLLAILRLMPLYRDIVHLPEWETAFKGALTRDHDDESRIGKLIYDIFEFAGFNLYAAFDIEGTKIAYDARVKRLEDAGIRVPPDEGLTDG
jgi:hypothetical protein